MLESNSNSRELSAKTGFCKFYRLYSKKCAKTKYFYRNQCARWFSVGNITANTLEILKQIAKKANKMNFMVFVSPLIGFFQKKKLFLNVFCFFVTKCFKTYANFSSLNKKAKFKTISPMVYFSKNMRKNKERSAKQWKRR